MVPHRRILQAISLLRMARNDGVQYAAGWCDLLQVAYPRCKDDHPILHFITKGLLAELPPEIQAHLLTASPDTMSREVVERAFAVLGIHRFLGADLTLNITAAIQKWRQNDTITTYIEGCSFASVPIDVMAEDLRFVWGFDIDEVDLFDYQELFTDKEHVRGDGWLYYETCIGGPAAMVRRRLIGQPHDFVRWKLGIPVSLKTEKVLDRLISDAYYTERLLKLEAGNMGLHLDKAQLTRIKMERDTIFKGLDQRQKIRNASGATEGLSEARKLLSAIVVEPGEPMVEVAPLMTELEDE